MPTDMFAIIPEIEALEVHFRQPITGSARDKWLVEWARDLAEFSLEDIRRGCARWRKDGQKFPRVGELIGAIQASQSVAQGGRVEVWREPSEAEYNALSVRDKIRHHQIMEHQFRIKAGPMYRNTGADNGLRYAKGEHLTRQQMPPEWHKHTATADFHRDRILELRGFLKTYAQQAPALAAPVQQPAVDAAELFGDVL